MTESTGEILLLPIQEGRKEPLSTALAGKIKQAFLDKTNWQSTPRNGKVRVKPHAEFKAMIGNWDCRKGKKLVLQNDTSTELVQKDSGNHFQIH